ncbi:MAG: hypothetical protein JWN25_3345 [Verrucomicrobiales bacterium]|jgi:hypothetical protein|nr:hypothetical protein [Verrucomicrobiales bacterium]
MVCLSLVAFAAGEESGAFASLANRDMIQVRMTTSCCLPLDATYLLRFERASNPHVTVSELERGVVRDRKFVIDTNRIELGELALTESDLAGLDKLMKFYHTKHDTLCSVVDRLKIARERDGKIVATEELTDTACSIYQTDYMTFHEIIRRLRKDKR